MQQSVHAVYLRPIRASSPIWTVAALPWSGFQTFREMTSLLQLPPKNRPSPTMASEIRSWLSSAAATSELNALTEIQGINDFPSNQTAASVNPTNSQEPLEGIDWNCLQDFEQPPPASKHFRASTSHIWDYRWRLYKPADGLDYWVCRLCHNGPRKPCTAAKSSYVCNQATSSAANHLEHKHFIRRDGVVARTASSTPSG
jgi:hypothetical protein